MITTDSSPSESTQPPIGYLLRKLDRIINERFERTLGTRDVTRRQWQLLRMIADRPATLDELSAAVAPFLDQAAGETAKQHLDLLTARGVVVAVGDAYDISNSGWTLFHSLNEQVQVTRELTVRGLVDGEYDRAIATLQTMVQNLEGD